MDPLTARDVLAFVLGAVAATIGLLWFYGDVLEAGLAALDDEAEDAETESE